jgi:hypothetical protein
MNSDAEWQTFRRIADDKDALARRVDDEWEVKIGSVTRRMSASEFERKFKKT